MNEVNDAALSKAVFKHELKVLKLTTGEEVVSKIRDLGDKYELIEAVQFRWSLEWDVDLDRNVERLSPNAFSVIIDIVLKGTCNYTLTLGKNWIKTKHPGTILNINLDHWK